MNTVFLFFKRIGKWLNARRKRLQAWISAKRFAPLSETIAEMRSQLMVMSKGQFGGKIGAHSSNEISDLISGFNTMAQAAEQIIVAATADRDRFSIVLSKMADGIIVVDADTRITLINAAARRIFKLREDTAMGRSFIEATHNAKIHNILLNCLRGSGQQAYTVEVYTNKLYLGVIVTPLQNNQGCILLIQDLTEIRRLEIVRRDFIANVSHELRTPISSLKVLAETLVDGALHDGSVAADFLGRIEVEVDKLSQMVNELSELSNIESGQVALVKTEVRIKNLVLCAEERLRQQIERGGLSVVIEIPDDLPHALIDRDRIERVLVNLIHNSIKFTPQNGLITIVAASERDNLLLSITDTGVGIEEEDLERIFERFYKSDKAHSGGGTGLGLAIARHTIEAHGGKIWAESVFGQGTTIHILLPIGISLEQSHSATSFIPKRNE